MPWVRVRLSWGSTLTREGAMSTCTEGGERGVDLLLVVAALHGSG